METWWEKILYKIGWYDYYLTEDGIRLLAYMRGVLENKRQPFNEKFEALLDDGSGRDRYKVAEEIVNALEGVNR